MLFTVPYDANKTVEGLREDIEAGEGIQLDMIRLIYHSQQLQDERTMLDYSIDSEFVVLMYFRMSGD